jgi:hypothetical protein
MLCLLKLCHTQGQALADQDLCRAIRLSLPTLHAIKLLIHIPTAYSSSLLVLCICTLTT